MRSRAGGLCGTSRRYCCIAKECNHGSKALAGRSKDLSESQSSRLGSLNDRVSTVQAHTTLEQSHSDSKNYCRWAIAQNKNAGASVSGEF
jgi:hypothetical protein